MAKGDTTPTPPVNKNLFPPSTGGIPGGNSSFNGPGAGMVFGKQAPQPLSFKQAYPASVEQAGVDYSGLMKQFGDIAKTGGGYDPSLVSYSPNADVTSSLGMLKDLASTGGYSEADTANLRARGISPIRSVYANAQSELQRGKSLSGGYSPNSAAVSAKMAREMSDKIAGQTSNVNAGIAEQIAQGKLAAAPQYAGASANEASAQRAIDEMNAAAKNRASEFGGNNKLNALNSMLSLYGTTPGLAQLFGNQALGAAGLQQNANATNQNTGFNLFSRYFGGR